MNDDSNRRFGAAQGWTAREEVDALLSGRGRFSADVAMEGQLHAAFLRSMFASGRLRGLDRRAAEAVPGVRAVLTGDDVRADGLGDLMPVAVFANADGIPMASTPRAPTAALAYSISSAGPAISAMRRRKCRGAWMPEAASPRPTRASPTPATSARWRSTRRRGWWR